MSLPELHHLSDDELVSYVEARIGGMDKTTWGDGPWQNEPDFEDFMYLGFQCHIRRHSANGNFVGYVAVHEGHPWHGVNYDGIRAEFHGGITFAGRYEEIYADEYLVGGDFGHSHDFSPAHHAAMQEIYSRRTSLAPSRPFDELKRGYKDIEYVRIQVQELARQALEAK